MQNLDILFLNLHRKYVNIDREYGGFLGIYILSAFARQQGYNGKGFSGTLKRGKEYIDKLWKSKSVSMIGLYCDYENVTENLFLSNYIKENYGIPVIVGGPQATALDENFFKNSKCDAVVRYEGELTVIELMNFFLEDVGRFEEIKGISYMTDQGIKINPNRPLIENLDQLPFIDSKCYLEPHHFYHNELSIMTGRGCPFHCTFCHEGSHTRKVRFRSVENVFEEIDKYLKEWRGDEIYILFTDDTFTLDKNRLHKICSELAKRKKKYNLKWFCEGHIHTLYKNPEMIKDLADGGCVRIQLGIESGTEDVLKSYGKNTTPDEIFEVVRKCRDYGIQQIYGNIILGGANFTRETYEKDRKFVHDLIQEGQGTLELGVITYWPLAETPITNQPSKFNLNIYDDQFLTSVGDFPLAYTDDLDRLTIMQMQYELEKEIQKQMTEMLENWQVPTSRVISWYPNYNNSKYSSWFLNLAKNEILFPYYKMIKLDEGVESKNVTNLEESHPLRVIQLYKYIKKIDENQIEICGEKFDIKDLDIITMTTGKLSVKEICNKLNIELNKVLSILKRLEQKHLIVYTF